MFCILYRLLQCVGIYHDEGKENSPGQAWHRRCGSDVKGQPTSLLVRAAPSRQTHSSMRSVSLSRTIFLSY